MTKQQVHQRIKKLRKLIHHHRYLSHVLDRQEISEAALDSLKKELFDLEQKFPELITPDSPTQRIAGKALEKFEKVQHTEPMLSFNDAFSREDMLAWEERIKRLLSEKEINQLDYFGEHKLDGLAVSLVYKKGVFVQGATRGDGRIGEDVSQNLKTIESVPLKLTREIDCEVRGEVLIKKKDFNLLNKQRAKRGEPPFANPRNTAAGAVRQLDPKIAAQRKLSFIAYQLLARPTQEQESQELKELGFKTADSRHCSGLEDVFGYYQEVLAEREGLSFQIDGIVVSVNENKVFEKLGSVGKAPRAAIAYKFPLKEAQTIVEDIKLQVGRTGAITPVAHLKPVNVGGATITRATLHNEDEVKRLGVKIGDTVIVGRAGDVIPQVVKVLKELRTGKEKPFKMPKKCPVCSITLVKPKGEVVRRCPNVDCRVRRKRQLYHFVSKAAFDIEGLGPKIIDQLLAEGLIQDAADLFELKEGDLLPLERFAEKSAENLIRAIQAKKKITLPRFIFALGIREVGEETAAVLAAAISPSSPFGLRRAGNFPTSVPPSLPPTLNLRRVKKLQRATADRQFSRPKEILKRFLELSQEDLQQIKDIGPVAARNLYDWFHNKRNITLLERLEKAGIKIEKLTESWTPSAQKKLGGQKFVLTGTLKNLTRDQAKEKIRALGGDIAGSVSKKTDFVVVGENPGSKLEKAKALGIKTLTEQEFLELLL